MELPPALRQAVDAALEGSATAALAEAADRLSRRYRAEVRDGQFHVSEDNAARAYLATRMPATYAAIRAALEAVIVALPDFAPASLLDLGAGPGTAFWAARNAWPSIDDAEMIEGSATMRRWGERLAEAAGPGRFAWRSADFTTRAPTFAPHDIVTIGYVLDELAPDARAGLVEAAWRATTGVLLIVEPGTPAGWRRILDARTWLISAGAQLVAPCAHDAPCPIVEPDWCHFSRRVARSRTHLRGKNAVVPFEDEKFIYVAATRQPVATRPARILAPPRQASGRVTLKLCEPAGTAAERLISRRDGELYKTARRLDWGDAIEA
ncbi:methyltransferase type 11 [Kaistia dalseonensis]|uniref:Ribosomal protein RSM22 (Predicted rRNA methylase) n=1 Tax=Kaistia dalseonensis TaxID=410840 RepID=A0ABU0HD76_9HYPH|nr:small ribosomal subunit Rsm22 family protein [Kaistia dalseonensis]MCX5497266.1 methyltransferase type 11 [Kaistia dalseonensis]MDQ0439902.1 ribosomal protein RSM22 (predicted rRNA methylase) [Kaistia dalseonensis]